MDLKALVNAIGQGALFNRNVETLGPEFMERLERIKTQREAERRAGEVHTRQLSSFDRSARREDLVDETQALRYPGGAADIAAEQSAQSEREAAIQEGQVPREIAGFDLPVSTQQAITIRGQNEQSARALAAAEARAKADAAKEDARDKRFNAALAQRGENAGSFTAETDAQGNVLGYFNAKTGEKLPPAFAGRKTAMPLTERKSMGALTETLRKLDELEALAFKAPDAHGGPFGIKGRVASVRRSAGLTTDAESDLIRKGMSIVEEFARMKEGAVLPEPMLQRLEKQLPNFRSPTFLNDIRSFRQEVTRMRQDLAGQGVIEPDGMPPQAPAGEMAPSGPRMGERKTFPNGNVGVWDGRGWVKQ